MIDDLLDILRSRARVQSIIKTELAALAPNFKPVAGTDSCQNNHVGYCVGGTLEVQLVDGQTATITTGDSYTIPPGHDAWVVGDEKFVGLEFLSAATFAKPE